MNIEESPWEIKRKEEAVAKAQLEAAVTLINEHQPKTLDDFKSIGFEPKFIGQGAFRMAWDIGFGLVAKIPMTGNSDYVFDMNRDHSDQEMRAVNRINTQEKYRALRTFIPDIFYYNKKAGVVVMRKYTKLRRNAKASFAISEIMSQLFAQFVNEDEGSDLHEDNIGVYKTMYDTEYKVLDLGCFAFIIKKRSSN